MIKSQFLDSFSSNNRQSIITIKRTKRLFGRTVFESLFDGGSWLKLPAMDLTNPKVFEIWIDFFALIQ